MVNGESWLDRDPDDLERRLIERGRRDKPPAAARRRTLGVTVAAAAGAGLAATSASASAAAAAVSSALPWLVATKWIVVGVAAGAVTLGVADGVQHRPTTRTEAVHAVAPPPVAAPTPTPAPATAVEPPAPAEVVPEPSGEAPVLPRAARPSAPRIEGPPQETAEIPPPPPEPARPSASARDEGSLEGEVRLLEEARRALDAHAAARALLALDRYAREFPAGRMDIESSALRIETLAALGQRDAARALAHSFLASHPRSPASMRVARLLDAIDSGAKP